MTDLDHDDEPLSECEEIGEHRDVHVLWESEGSTQYECKACGAEWFDDED